MVHKYQLLSKTKEHRKHLTISY